MFFDGGMTASIKTGEWAIFSFLLSASKKALKDL